MADRFKVMEELNRRGALPEKFRAEYEAMRSREFDSVAQKEAAKKMGQVYGDRRAKAQIDLPVIRKEAGLRAKQVRELSDHPGMSASVGLKNPLKGNFGFLGTLPGTDSADFMSRYDQIKGQQFLEAFEKLKGGGQITEIEGTKATAAISRMSTAQSEAEFKKAAAEFIGTVEGAIARVEREANLEIPSGGVQRPAGAPQKRLVYDPATGEFR